MTGVKQMSYCYWVKVNTAWSAQWLDGITWYSTDGSSAYVSRQEFYTNCTLIGTWYKGGSISGKTFTPGVWTHIAGVFDYIAGTFTFYINGISVGTTTNVDKTHYCRGDFYIGDNGVDICENDVRIYDHCLSAAEVHEISQGLVLHYKLDDITNGIVDSSGYGHNGTIINTVTLDSNTPRYTNSLNFNENADSITVSPYLSANQTLDAITISCWFKTNTMNSTAPNIFSLGENAFLRCRLGATNAIWSYYRVVSTQCANTYSCKTLTDNAWHLLTFTFNKGTQVVYIDGKQIGTANNSGTGTYLTCASTAWHLAGYTANSENFIGNLSDFRIYCTALSADDILSLYHTAAKVDNLGGLHTFEFQEKNNPKIYKTGITEHKLLTESRLLNDVSTISFQPSANANNSCSSFVTLDIEEFANIGDPVTIHVSYLASWTNFAAGTGGTFNIRMHAQNRKKETNSWAWESSTFMSGNFTSAINANSTGFQQYDFDTTIPASYFSTYNGSKCRIRCDYSNGNGVITLSNIKITLQPNKFKIKNNYLQANNLIEK